MNRLYWYFLGLVFGNVFSHLSKLFWNDDHSCRSVQAPKQMSRRQVIDKDPQYHQDALVLRIATELEKILRELDSSLEVVVCLGNELSSASVVEFDPAGICIEGSPKKGFRFLSVRIRYLCQSKLEVVTFGFGVDSQWVEYKTPRMLRLGAADQLRELVLAHQGRSQ